MRRQSIRLNRLRPERVDLTLFLVQFALREIHSSRRNHERKDALPGSRGGSIQNDAGGNRVGLRGIAIDQRMIAELIDEAGSPAGETEDGVARQGGKQRSLPARHHSERQSGIVAAVVFPYLSMLIITFDRSSPIRSAVASMIRRFA